MRLCDILANRGRRVMKNYWHIGVFEPRKCWEPLVWWMQDAVSGCNKKTGVGLLCPYLISALWAMMEPYCACITDQSSVWEMHEGVQANWTVPAAFTAVGACRARCGLLTVVWTAIFAPLFSKVGLLASCCLKAVTGKARNHCGSTVQKACVATLQTMPWNMHSLNSLISNEKGDFQSLPDSKQVPRAAVSPLTAP